MSAIDDRILISRAYDDMSNFYIEGLLVPTTPDEPEMTFGEFVEQFRDKYIPEDRDSRSLQMDAVAYKLDTIERLIELLRTEAEDFEGILAQMKGNFK